MNYIILEDNRKDILEKEVNEKLSEGYDLVGGCSQVMSGDSFYYTQAMIKEIV